MSWQSSANIILIVTTIGRHLLSHTFAYCEQWKYSTSHLQEKKHEEERVKTVTLKM